MLTTAQQAIYKMNSLQSQFFQQKDLLDNLYKEHATRRRCTLNTAEWVLTIILSIVGGIFATALLIMKDASLLGGFLYELFFLGGFLFLCLWILFKLINFVAFLIWSRTAFPEHELQYNSCMDSQYNQMSDFYQSGYKSALFIPPNYRYPLAIDYIISCFANGRAETLMDTINLYEQQVHYWKIENYFEQLNAIQWQQNLALSDIEYYSHRAATAAGVSAFNSFFR